MQLRRVSDLGPDENSGGSAINESLSIGRFRNGAGQIGESEMSVAIRESVGLRGSNRHPDVTIVQDLLMRHGFVVGPIDGRCGRRTIAAILSFQKNFFGNPDGLISVDGFSWKKLSEVVSANSAPKSKNSGTTGRDWTELTSIPSKDKLNIGLSPVSNSLLIGKFGHPREDYGQDCQPITNTDLKKKMSSGVVGNFKVTGMSELIISLQKVFTEISTSIPEIYPLIGTAGMLCCRYQRNSTVAISNHSWGSAIDLKISGSLDARGDGKVQKGLLLIAPIFNNHGWYWGAGFSKEDSMHFEASKSLVDGIA